MTGRIRRLRSLPKGTALAIAVLVLDQLSKHWAINSLSLGNPRHVFGSLQWNLTFNSGMSFSKGQGAGPVIGVLAIIVAVSLLLSLRKGAGRLLTLAVGLIAGGAIGNVADRLFRGSGFMRGKVIDFVDVQWWPIWNVADMGVVVGGILMALALVLERRVPTLAISEAAGPEAAAPETVAPETVAPEILDSQAAES